MTSVRAVGIAMTHVKRPLRFVEPLHSACQRVETLFIVTVHATCSKTMDFFPFATLNHALHLSLGPLASLRSHLHCGQRPVLSVVCCQYEVRMTRRSRLTVPFILSPSDTRTLQRLVIGQSGQNTENDRRSGIQLDAHQSVRNSVANVLKVHG